MVMPALDHAGARELLLRVVNKYYTERHSPLPGAFVKAQMLADAKLDGHEFSESILGFRKFTDFIRTIPDVAIQGRSGSDVLLAPVTASELLAAYAAPLPRLRRDFWRAFIEFRWSCRPALRSREDRIVHVRRGCSGRGSRLSRCRGDAGSVAQDLFRGTVGDG